MVSSTSKSSLLATKENCVILPDTRGGKRVTLKDVAERAGTSYAGVSVVLNGAKSNTHVSEALRQRILEVAVELGYKRNSSMVVGRTGRFGTVALLLSTHLHRSNLPPRTWDGIQDELASRDVTLSVARLPDEQLTDAGVVPKMLREWMADGLLVDYTNHIPVRMLELIRGHNLPAVWLNSQQDSDCVYPDERAAGRRAAEHLLALGHRRLAYYDFTHAPDNSAEHYSARDRLRGFEETVVAARLKPQVVLEAALRPAMRLSRIKELLQKPGAPTGIVGYGMVEGELVMSAALALNIEVPRELSFVLFGQGPASHAGLHLTCVTTPDYDMGREATRRLMEKIDFPARSFPPRVLDCGFDVGESTALVPL